MKIVLIILDGWGISRQEKGNAIAAAALPTMEYIQAHYPSCLLKASGTAVGLPWVEPGNSEVAHLVIGSGRVSQQAMSRILEALRNGSFFSNRAFLNAIDHVKAQNSQLHLMGLLGSGSVHSYMDHLYGLLELAGRMGVSSRVKLHLFTDGSDSPPHEAQKVIERLKIRLTANGESRKVLTQGQVLNEFSQGEIATIIGRDWAMDRDQNWAKTQEAFELFTQGKGQKAHNEVEVMARYYQEGFADGKIPPTVLLHPNGAPRGLIKPHDSVIFFNYREDSMRQLAKAFLTPLGAGFRPQVPDDLVVVTMTEYERGLGANVAFGPEVLGQTLAQVLSQAGKTQLHLAETHKYAHVTYFFNGMNEKRHQGEVWQLIPSIHTEDFVAKPELKALEIASEAGKAIRENTYDFILLNFANADVLAHTGDFQATVQSCQFADQGVKEILDTINASPDLASQWAVIITSDHGHAERMLDLASGSVLTAHTSNDVPLYLVTDAMKKDLTPLEIFSRTEKTLGTLADIAPTILELYGVAQPPAMTGKSLLRPVEDCN